MGQFGHALIVDTNILMIAQYYVKNVENIHGLKKSDWPTSRFEQVVAHQSHQIQLRSEMMRRGWIS